MWFPKSPAHSDFKYILDCILSVNKVKDIDETILGRQNHALIYVILFSYVVQHKMAKHLTKSSDESEK